MIEQVFTLAEESDRRKLILYLQRLSLGPKRKWEVVVRQERRKRSTAANRRYWAVLRDIADQVRPEGRRFDETSWHELFKGKILGFDEIALPNGETRLLAISTTTLSTSEFADYTQQIEAWAASRGVRFQDDYLT